MGTADSEAQTSALDLPFDELERLLVRLLDDNVPQPSTSQTESQTRSLLGNSDILIEDKRRYLLKVHDNILASKSKFLESCINIRKGIETMAKEIVRIAETRERELKAQLQNIGAQKLEEWDSQLSLCSESLNQLPELLNDFNSSTFVDINFVDAGDIKFEYNNKSILNSIKTVGTITYPNQSNWNEISVLSLRAIVPKFIIGSGSGGSEPGQFCRPWGVCADVTGRILVCDRSNHRIQIFDESGQFLIEFGKEGTKSGEFNRPSGIDVDAKYRIIVADKDNHRVQVFSYNGLYLFQFGGQGKRPGQFMYPWDVSANQNCQIAVSDSKNHRVQFFNEDGVFITHFDATKMGVHSSRLSLKYFDSPRGVAFRKDGSLLVTDFNNHRILLISPNFKKVSSFGCEGHSSGQFFRPQGITCDERGNFAVSDSKNYRIQVFNSKGKLLKMFGSQGDSPGQFDCPQGICYHPNQNIVVVDFINNRVQVF